MFLHRHSLKRTLLLLLKLLYIKSLYHENEFSSWIFLLVAGYSLREHHRLYRLMLLGDLSGKCYMPVTESLHEFRQSLLQLVRSLIHHHGPSLTLHLLENPRPVLLVIWKKCLKCKSSCRKPRAYECRYTCTGTWNRRNFKSGIKSLSHKLLPGIRYTWSSRIGYDCHILSLLHLLNENLRLVVFVVFMITRHRGLDLKMIEQLDTVSCILRRYHIHLFKNPDGPVCHILKIAYRCRHQV